MRATLLVLFVLAATAAGDAGASAVEPASDGALVGGAKAVPEAELATDEHLLLAAAAAAREIEASAPASLKQHLVASRVLSATKQVVSGVLYRMEVEVAPTDCSRDFDYDAQPPLVCAANNAHARVYDAVVLWQAWRKDEAGASSPYRVIEIKRWRFAGTTNWISGSA